MMADSSCLAASLLFENRPDRLVEFLGLGENIGDVHDGLGHHVITSPCCNWDFIRQEPKGEPAQLISPAKPVHAVQRVLRC